MWITKAGENFIQSANIKVEPRKRYHGKRGYEEMANMFQTLARESHILYERAMEKGLLAQAAYYQRQGARDHAVAWEYLQGAIARKEYD